MTKQLLQRGFRYALSLSHDVNRAEDLLQDALVAILERGVTPTAGYLMRTIRNRFIDLYRRERLVVMKPLEEAYSLAVLDEESGIDAERLEEALRRLRPQEREALYLASVEGYTAQEIADFTGRPRNTVLSLIHRARRKMRAHLSEEVA